jgi:ribulose-5-phosphate 4-epimerase/fuculose-1-phosphate aldolase
MSQLAEHAPSPTSAAEARAELALLARILARQNFGSGIGGHLTYRLPDGTLLANRFGLTWAELRAGDIVRIDLEGHLLDGPGPVPQAIQLHLALHAARTDVVVAVHSHPDWATVWADLHRIPPVYDQDSAASGTLVLHDQYDGSVVDPGHAGRVVDALADADSALLANHGVLVTAPTVRTALMRCGSLETRCRRAWHVEALGGSSGGVPLRDDVYKDYVHLVNRLDLVETWAAAVRAELGADSSVLDPEPSDLSMPTLAPARPANV